MVRAEHQEVLRNLYHVEKILVVEKKKPVPISPEKGALFPSRRSFEFYRLYPMFSIAGKIAAPLLKPAPERPFS